MPSYYQVKSFVRHWLLKVDDHSVHSPFFFDFYRKVVSKKNKSDLPVLENLRYDLESSEIALNMNDLGSGSRGGKPPRRTIREIARGGLTPFPVAMFYLDLLYLVKAQCVVELGTSLGLTTLYLAQKKDATIYTFEGCHDIANTAITNFEWANKKNIELIEGNIDSTLHKFLQFPHKIDFALIDANHYYGPTMLYYRELTKRLHAKSILVIDDIHRSPEMDKAWREISSDVLVYASVDLHSCGVLFFDPAMNKQHYIFSLK